MLCGSMDGREVWGRMGKCVCVPESLCYSLKTITTLLNDYSSTQKKKFKTKKKKERNVMDLKLWGFIFFYYFFFIVVDFVIH